jgi:hypothetical protein
MSVRVSSVYMLSCLDSGLATGLITCRKSPTNCLNKIQSSRLKLVGNRSESII